VNGTFLLVLGCDIALIDEILLQFFMSDGH